MITCRCCSSAGAGAAPAQWHLRLSPWYWLCCLPLWEDRTTWWCCRGRLRWIRFNLVGLTTNSYRQHINWTRVPKNTYPVCADEHTLSEYCTCSNNCAAVAGVLHCTRLSRLASLSSLTEAEPEIPSAAHVYEEVWKSIKHLLKAAHNLYHCRTHCS